MRLSNCFKMFLILATLLTVTYYLASHRDIIDADACELERSYEIYPAKGETYDLQRDDLTSEDETIAVCEEGKIIGISSGETTISTACDTYTVKVSDLYTAPGIDMNKEYLPEERYTIEENRYLDDVLAYVAVGARSVEDQQHRLTASGIEVPVGMKNPTSGDYSVMMNAIQAAQHPHTFIYRGWEVHSQGNPYSHAILRGSISKHGNYVQNYHYEDLIRLLDEYAERDLQNPAVVIDTNHANSKKNPFEQPRIIMEVLNSRRYNKGIASILKGFMVESYIEDGAQSPGENCYGKSITDPCLGWEKTERLIYDIADKL